MFKLKKKVFVVLIMLAVLGLTACGSLEVEGEAVKAVDLTLTPGQARHPLGLFGAVKKAKAPSEEEVLAENNQAEIVAEVPLTPTADVGVDAPPTSEITFTPTPIATDSNQQPTDLPPTAAPKTPTPVPPAATPIPPTVTPTYETGVYQDAIYEESFWPGTNSSVYYEDEWDFGARFDFSSSQETSVSFMAFGIYRDELGSFSSIVSSCMSGQMPVTHMERPFWSKGTETTYPAGRHVFEQNYHYSGSLDGITQIVLWLVQKQNGQIVHCKTGYYSLLTRSEFILHSLQFTPNISDVLDQNTQFNFGAQADFSIVNTFDVSLLAFPIYADEGVPTEGLCWNRQARIPSEHPDRPFWSTGTSQTFPAGRHTFIQNYTFSHPIPDATHLALWLGFWHDGILRECEEQYYTLSSD